MNNKIINNEKKSPFFGMDNFIFVLMGLIFFLVISELLLGTKFFDIDKRINQERSRFHKKIPINLTPMLGVGALNDYFYAKEINPMYSRDRFLFWRLNQNEKLMVNAAGFRGPQVNLEKKEGVFRIICLGDSITFGYGLNYTQSYPKLLEDLLNKSTFSLIRYEVINAGVPGYTALQGIRFYKSRFRKYDADMLIVFFGSNDFDNNFYRDREIIIRSNWLLDTDNFLNNFRFYRFLKFVIFKLTFAGKNFPQRVSLQEFRSIMDEFEQIAESEGIGILFVFPVWLEAGTLVKNNKIDREPLVDIYTAFLRRDNPSIIISEDGIHPNYLGQKIIAREIYKKLTEVIDR